MTIKLAAADLNYLLQQVNIGNDYTQLGSPLDPLGVREVSGQNNNLVGGFTYNADGTVTWTGNNINPDWGQSDTDFLRIFTTNHPTNGTTYGVTFNPITMQVIDSSGQPVLGSDGQPLLVPNAFANIMTTAPGTSPRTITQLIANSDVDPTSPTYNPAAAAAMDQMGGEPVPVSNTVVGSTQTGFIPNPGILGGVPYNEFFVEFGQFFDHGLDFITKGGGYVLIPLAPTDPLYDPSATGPFANKMMLSRGALSNPASDFTIDSLGNAVLKSTAVPAFNNNTGLLIDQSQTYGSVSTINVLVRQYDANGNVTGKLITSAEDMAAPEPGATQAEIDAYNKALHDLGTWADMKVNAARLGIALTDLDVTDAPMIRADAVGKLLFTPQHTVMYSSDKSIADTVGYNAANDPFVRWTSGDAVAGYCLPSQVGYAKHTGHAVISDMGSAASPLSPTGQVLQPMGTTDPEAVPGSGQYNEALLASHYVSGDHRANENVGLTAMHHIFHEEHNIEADAIKIAALRDADASGNPNFLNGYTDANGKHWDGYLANNTGLSAALAAITASSTDAEVLAAATGLNWDGEKIYQAARIITESEYNHIAIDQYVGGLVVLPEFVSYSSDINIDVSLEFSQAVFRLGHSQLSETLQIAIPDANNVKPGEAGYVPTYTSVDLFDAFLNPSLYDESGPGGIALGLLNQQGNEIDEFVTAAVQQSLVGVPLDLAALNISRGRDIGLPTLNEVRQQIFDGLVQNTNNASNPGIAPYTSWDDFGGHLRHPESLVNFIAAYGRENATFHLQDMRVAYEAGTLTLQELRANAQHILDAAADLNDPDHAAAVLFLRGQGSPVYDPVTGTWNQNNNGGGDLGFWDVDLWIGGLAEQPLFDGPLGTTFTFIMADFGQRMQDADRFYYLYRMPVGQHLGDQIIGEQFSDLIMRTTGLEHIGDAFGFQSATYILDGTNSDGSVSDNPYDGTGAADHYGINDYFNSIYESLPDSVRAFVVANSSFEVDSLATGAPGVTQNAALGNYTTTAPSGWTITQGAGGAFAPTIAAISDAGHAGGQVAYLQVGASQMVQDTGATLAEGSTYTLTLNIGNRADLSGAFGATVKLVAVLADGTRVADLGTTVVSESDVPDGAWRPVTVSTGPLAAAYAGLVLRVEITNSGGGDQVLVDNVSVAEVAAGGSANDGHNVIAGLEGNDYLIAGLGDDYVYGDEGNDVIEGAQGNDHLYGGAGNDWITDYENDDFISGGEGNDYISAGPGVLDTSHGNAGDDEVHGGDGVDEVFGDDGDDRLYGDGDTDLIMGGDGNDYMDGGDSVDEMFGGNGNDWMRGGVGDDNINGGSGNDLMEGGLGPTANDGDRLNGDTAPNALPVIEFNGDGTEGDMDIVSYEDVAFAITASLQDANGNGTSSNLLDTYALDEGLVGSAQNDTLTGADADGTAGNGVNNYLVGGGGNDVLSGLGDDGNQATGAIDYIFGDSVIVDNNLYWIGDTRHAATGHGGIDTDGYLADGVTANAERLAEGLAFNGDGKINNWQGTGEIRVVFEDGTLGHILGDNGAEGSSDVAVYRGAYNAKPDGTSDNYKIEYITIGGQDAVRITDLRAPTDVNGNPVATDGVDILVGVESARFSDGKVVSLVPTPPTLDLHAFNITSNGNVADNFNAASWSSSTGSVGWAGNWSETGDTLTGNVVTGGQIQIDAGGGGGSNQLRLLDNGDGASIQRSFSLSGSTNATLSFDYSENSFDNNESVVASVSFNGGTTWHALPSLTLDSSTGGGGTYSVELATLLGSGESFGSNTIVKFEALTSTATGQGANNGYIAIDNLSNAKETRTPDNDATNNYATVFTEGGARAPISLGSLITDELATNPGQTLASARVTLNDAVAGDAIRISGSNSNSGTVGGLTYSVDSSVAGQITLDITGTGTLAQYASAIDQVRYFNSGDNPTLYGTDTSRTIQVTVNDGQWTSSIATATVTVAGVNDGPNANNDSIIVNVAPIDGSQLLLPEQVLTLNDTDPDTAVLHVTAASNSSDLASVSVASGVLTITNNTQPGTGNDTDWGTFNYTVSDGSATDTAAVSSINIDSSGPIDGTNGANAIYNALSSGATLNGNGGNDVLVGNVGNDSLVGGTGNDTVNGGGGDDTIAWNVGDGRDVVNGGDSSAAVGDRFTVTGNNQAETYDIYSMVDPVNAGLAASLGTTFRADTKIVITRTVGNNTAVVAELNDIEELTIDTVNVSTGGISGGNGPGTDLVAVHGNFTGTGLNPNTITISGREGHIVVDVSQMTSDEHVVLNTGGTYEVVHGTDTAAAEAAPSDAGAGAGTPGGGTTTEAGGTAPGEASTAAGGSAGTASSGAPSVVGGSGESLIGTSADDVIIGPSGNKVIYADAGDDVVHASNDGGVVIAGDGDDIVDGGSGGDIVIGGAGNDVIAALGGNDKLWGDDGSDVIYGDDGNDMLFGGAGRDELHGGAGDDRLEGGDGSDVLFGDGGNDLYVFRSVAAANGDTIADFQAGDTIELGGLAANGSSFKLAEGGSFTAAGQLIVSQTDDHTAVISGTTDGATADFTITVHGDFTLDQLKSSIVV